MNGSCLILFADSDFNLLSEIPIDTRLANELVTRSLPKGSHWGLFTGARSLSFFSLEDNERFVLSYSVITESSDVPIINFLLLGSYVVIASILKRQLIGIQSAYFRRLSRFKNLDEIQSTLLIRNILSLRVSKAYSGNSSSRKHKVSQVYKNPTQWLDVEQSIISVAAKDLRRIRSFRTLTLQPEKGFPFLGVADNPKI